MKFKKDSEMNTFIRKRMSADLYIELLIKKDR